MKNILILALVSIPVLVVLDVLWIGIIAQAFYQSQIGFLLAPTVTWWAAVLFYLIYSFALVYFVVRPALEWGTARSAFLTGLLFGLAAFATYDLTNLATTKEWPVLVTFVDMAYGTIVAGVTSLTAYMLGKKLLRM